MVKFTVIDLDNTTWSLKFVEGWAILVSSNDTIPDKILDLKPTDDAGILSLRYICANNSTREILKVIRSLP